MGFELHSELFIEEAMDLLRDIEAPLLELEASPDRKDLIDSIFRAMHTIKGSAAMFGFEDVSHFTHDIETTFDAIRKGTLSVTPEIIELTLTAKDCIREMLLKKDSSEELEKRTLLLSKLSRISGITQKATGMPEPVTAIEKKQSGAAVPYHITFIPDRNIFLRGVKAHPLLADLSSLGQLTVNAVLNDIPFLEEFDPEQCYLSWKMDIVSGSPVEDIRSVFIFVEDYAKIIIEKKTDISPTEQGGSLKKMPAVERRRVDATSIRVKNEKLDNLVNLVGEMVTLHARLVQESNRERLPEFISISESLGRLTADLRDITMSVRMVPLSETFSSFNRLVHDLSKTLGKQIRLVSEGGETELDKNVIEELRDPLMHIIRNAADHAIEMPDVRTGKGKEREGLISLSAEYSGANVRIRIQDDGAGLNKEKILSAAIARGMTISPDADDAEIYQLIFAPGFSTAVQATDISGRGVGMDVVKKNLEKLRGSIGIVTEKDKGTTISLTIPLTLAIIDGFMCEVGRQPYIFNLSLVRECIAFDDKADEISVNRLVRIRDSYVPFVNLRNTFSVSDSASPYPQIVVTEYEGNTIGFLVDKVIGHCQTVIKPLGKGVKNAVMFSGASILGDGSIALILDLQQIIAQTEIADLKAAEKSALYDGG